ncbi:MAG: NAD(P)H-dependent oxidoreductase [Ignavibacteriales bacterium]
MKACIVMDRDFQTRLYDQLKNEMQSYLSGKGFEIEEILIGAEDLFFCKGCFGCWVKKPGECVINDDIGRINRTLMNSDVTIYLCPVIFGQFSPNIKNSIDRWLPNMLPFFMVRKDGSTMHPPRYESYPAQIMAGYADDLSKEDAQLFTDINKNHRNNVEVLIYWGSETDVPLFMDGIKLQRIGGSL